MESRRVTAREREALANPNFEYVSIVSIGDRKSTMYKGSVGVKLLEDEIRSRELKVFLDFVSKNKHLNMGKINPEDRHANALVSVLDGTEKAYTDLRKAVDEVHLADPGIRIGLAKLSMIAHFISEVDGLLGALDLILTHR